MMLSLLLAALFSVAAPGDDDLIWIEGEAAKTKEIGWIQEELKGVHQLWKQNLVPFSRVTALERDAARVAGERGGFSRGADGISAGDSV